nr:ATP-dependent RNA helicase glh-2-like isoform X2 [Anser cygnoides]
MVVVGVGAWKDGGHGVGDTKGWWPWVWGRGRTVAVGLGTWKDGGHRAVAMGLENIKNGGHGVGDVEGWWPRGWGMGLENIENGGRGVGEHQKMAAMGLVRGGMVATGLGTWKEGGHGVGDVEGWWPRGWGMGLEHIKMVATGLGTWKDGGHGGWRTPKGAGHVAGERGRMVAVGLGIRKDGGHRQKMVVVGLGNVKRWWPRGLCAEGWWPWGWGHGELVAVKLKSIKKCWSGGLCRERWRPQGRGHGESVATKTCAEGGVVALGLGTWRDDDHGVGDIRGQRGRGAVPALPASVTLLPCEAPDAPPPGGSSTLGSPQRFFCNY